MRSLLFLFALTLVPVTPSLAQRDKKAERELMNDLSHVALDPAFHVQGEYVGHVTVGEKQKLGLQVIARGNRTFEAWAHWGGLPGAGWDRSRELKLAGKTKRATTVLEPAEPTKHEKERRLSRAKVTHGERDAAIGSIRIEFGAADVLGPGGAKIGRLSRVIRKSPTLGKKPPAGAIAFFDGSSTDGFNGGRLAPDGFLMHGTETKTPHRSGTFHIEFRLPFMPNDRGQGRGNSGVYFQKRYEVQVLDSFGLAGFHNECGGIYSKADPAVNMCLPPMQWQTYDVEFTEAKYDDSGKRVEHALLTVWHNGVLIHKDQPVDKRTTAARAKNDGPDPEPLDLQNHSCPVRYRNIWFVPRD